MLKVPKWILFPAGFGSLKSHNTYMTSFSASYILDENCKLGLDFYIDIKDIYLNEPVLYQKYWVFLTEICLWQEQKTKQSPNPSAVFQSKSRIFNIWSINIKIHIHVWFSLSLEEETILKKNSRETPECRETSYSERLGSSEEKNAGGWIETCSMQKLVKSKISKMGFSKSFHWGNDRTRRKSAGHLHNVKAMQENVCFTCQPSTN